MVSLARKQGKMGEMDIDFAESYDSEDDIYYVTFKTGEPSYVVELDDAILLEVGMFTNMTTGFRILNFKKNKIAHLEFKPGELLKETFSEQKEQLMNNFRERTESIERRLEKVLA